MEIKDLFYRPIDRYYERVVKADAMDEETLKQELDEYVVTDELEKYFGRFFHNYSDSISHPTNEAGVWISGYFGSGKSHFLKMLAYLLENRVVDGKHAIDYFDADRKIKNPDVIADIRKAEAVPTDVILFDIDAKHSESDKNTILGVFNKLFNEMQGFYGANPVLADLERYLDSKGRYEEFKRKYEEKSGSDWVTDRNTFDFSQEFAEETLLEMGIWKDKTAADMWCEKAVMPGAYNLSIEEFAKRVKNYLDAKGKNHRIVFLLDEMGQFILQREGRMLNLQTMVEMLGTNCRGRAWVVVTSQQNIDEIKQIDKFTNYDFSKIQSRFHTRISLSSAEAATIIKKRILEKKNEVRPLLKSLYNQNETVISNLLQFSDGPEHKLYTDAVEFTDVYPIVTYQFNLIAASLDSIQQAGGSGKDGASTERTLLDLCKQSCMHTMDAEAGALVPLHYFYDALEDKLEHSVRTVITHALQNKNINPDGEEDNFTVNVLKTLFLIKNVQIMKGTIENITTLMIDDIHADREVVMQQVKQSLRILDKEMLIQQNGDTYTFLSDEEQRTNRLIANTEITRAERFKEIGQIIFDTIYKETKYRYPYLGNRYNFPFSARFNDQYIRQNIQDEIGIIVLAAGSEVIDSPELIRTKSMGEMNSLLIVLPAGYDEYVTEVIKALQIRKFFRTHTSSDIPNHDIISSVKQKEASERTSRATEELRDALSEARFYVRGDELSIRSKEAAARINEGMGRLISRVYDKLSYIETAMSEKDIDQALSRAEDQMGTVISADTEANPNAQEKVLEYIGSPELQHKKVTRKNIESHFQRIPFGYNALDVEWILARLLRRRMVNFYVSDDHITLENTKRGDLRNILITKNYLEKLTVEKRERVPLNQLQSVRNVLSELLDHSTSQNDEDSLMADFGKYANEYMKQLTEWKLLCESKGYPGLETIKRVISIFNEIGNTSTTKAFFRKVYENEEDLLDEEDELRSIRQFFQGTQHQYFDEGKANWKRFIENKSYIHDPQLIEIAQSIKGILDNASPYDLINNLYEYNGDFENLYKQLLEMTKDPVVRAIQEEATAVIEALKEKPYGTDYFKEVKEAFNNLTRDAGIAVDIGPLKGLSTQAQEDCRYFMNQFGKWQAKWDEEHKPPEPPKPPVKPGSGDEPGGEMPESSKPPVQPKYRRMRDVIHRYNWEISTDADIDSVVEEIRKKLQEELKEYKKINIQF